MKRRGDEQSAQDDRLPALADRGSSLGTRRRAVRYYFSKMLALDFDAAVAEVTRRLKDEGFGILTQIDVRETLKNKIGVEFRPYRILGACNPSLALEALQLEDKVGTMLPCNVIVQELAPGRVEIAAIDPVASMTAIDNPALLEKAQIVRGKLEKVVCSL
jgi:uncharacterized protein (DUF302 family)